ncbi:MAG: response regulator [Minwuia sp.]|uniref:response regulator n=1 Tax=Minwuia sp. TaxID=2493630 RepID=UPI003A85DD8B
MQRRPHILIVDDDREIRDLLARFLVRHDFRVDTAADGREMDKVLAGGRFDLIVLDLMMPGEDGLAICKRLRNDTSIPIVMLTALGEEADRIVGLEIGADDYLPKPFNPRELLARVRAVLRRVEATPEAASGTSAKTLTFDGWQVDLRKRELRDPEGTLVTLTSGEFDLLEALVERPQQILSRDQLADLTSGRQLGPLDRSIDVALSRLRRKLGEDPKSPQLIKTVRHGGYYFAAEVEGC